MDSNVRFDIGIEVFVAGGYQFIKVLPVVKVSVLHIGVMFDWIVCEGSDFY